MSIGTSTYVNNLKQIQDKIYSVAQGYVESYDIVNEERMPGGGYRITVSARVSKERLSSDVSPIVGGGIVQLNGQVSLANIDLDLKNQREMEKAFKGLLDELAGPALQISYNTRVGVNTESPGKVKIYFDDLAVKFDPNWYRRYRAFHKQLMLTPFAGQAIEHGYQYTYIDRMESGADGRRLTFPAYLVADFLNADGEVITSVTTSAPSVHSYWTNWGDGTLRSLVSTTPVPVIPPAYGARSGRANGTVDYTVIDRSILEYVKSIRLRNPDFSAYTSWPVALD